MAGRSCGETTDPTVPPWIYPQPTLFLIMASNHRARVAKMTLFTDPTTSLEKRIEEDVLKAIRNTYVKKKILKRPQ